MELLGETLPPPIGGEPMLKPVPKVGGVGNAPVSTPAPAAAAPKAVTELAFVDRGAREATVPLRFAFELDGVRHDAVQIRRLTTEQVRDLIDAGASGLDLYDAYSAMTGLPAPVLRGLDGDDGLDVTEKCSDFLPRLLKTAFGLE